eukprot:1795169-Lingulodinium_polyedra.AAC.1
MASGVQVCRQRGLSIPPGRRAMHKLPARCASSQCRARPAVEPWPDTRVPGGSGQAPGSCEV